ncbi:hypothetical protein [Nocardioides ferulae]|uniref:hypothetical protein n=1 Tax=Nocardioides ferulae TaxID=2340821 RepID=UPI000EAB9942|nr:hypothetical protein [Nocardioides ferulae]
MSEPPVSAPSTGEPAGPAGRDRRRHALELVPDEAGQEAVRRDWQRLRDAGLPSQLDHRGPTNAPHLTVVSAPELPEAALDVARVRLGALLPVRARAAGILLLGGPRLTVARAVDLDDDVVRRVLAVRVQVPDRDHVGWLPHVTLARRLDRSDAQRALDVLGHDDVVLRLSELRRWNPDRGWVTTIAQA